MSVAGLSHYLSNHAIQLHMTVVLVHGARFH